MESYPQLRSLLATEEGLAESRLRNLSRVLENEAAGLPSHILEALNHLKQNAEEDLSNILHIQSTIPNMARKTTTSPRSKVSPALTVKNMLIGDSGAVLGQVDEGVETATAVTDNLFLMDGVEILEDQSGAQTPSYSDEDIEDSELDEGIYMPSQGGDLQPTEVAASLPVGIPWPVQQPRTNNSTRTGDDSEAPPKDIAASMAAMAKSVCLDNVFGDLPRPRLNTASKE